jgi:3-oxoacyl-[acyl-carrier protein] reductase
MRDFLLENRNARRVIQSLGLPIPLPQKLRRAEGPWRDRPLQDHDIVIAGVERSALGDVLSMTLAAAGANPLIVGDADLLKPFVEAGEAYGRPPKHLSNGAMESIDKIDAVIFDATGVSSPEDLGVLYELFHPWVRKLKKCGRVVILGRPLDEARSVAEAAAQRALDGFVRSLSKEVGRKGTTAQLITVASNAASRLPGILRFVLSSRSTFVTGQPLHVTSTTRAPEQTPWVRVLDGKVALVTGAARGIGKATAGLLAAEGAHVVCLDRPADDGPCSQVAREVGGSVLLADVSDPGAPEDIVACLADRGVDVVVHNAGVTRDKTIARMKRDQWDQALDINLAAVLRITDALIDKDVLNDNARIVCLSSVAGIAGNMGQTNYAASKAGIIGLVQHLAPQLAERGITVNAVAPGFIETRLTAAIPTFIREAGRRLSSLGQGGLPQDVGELITFLASPGASGISGRVVRVCGGAMIGA